MLQVHPHVCWLSHVKSEISVIFPVKSSYHQDNKPPPDGWGEINRLMLEDPWRAQPDTIVQHSWNFSDDDTPVRYHLPGVGPVFFSTTRTWPAERHQRNWSTSNAGNSSHVWLLEDRTVAVQNMVCWRYGMFLPIPRHEWLYTYQVVLAWLLYGIQDNWWQCKTYRGGT